ncbi:MAG: GNAT family N-acetyltransferase [Gulosibacter sp.]|uniref:GNAT family N-acetyltransferase n=1 Tax=Gulosibacter sp. TaxID=2817531 RepID=UPI003F903E1B
MDGQEIQQFAMRLALELPEVTQSNPFGPDYEVFKVVDKVFMLTSEIDIGPVISLKCEPEYGTALRQEHDSIIPGYHLNKRHWISIGGGSSITEDLLRDLVLNSYELVVEKMPKKQRPARDAVHDIRIVVAESPAELVENSALFDEPVLEASAADFLARPGHVLFLALDPAGKGIGFVSGVEMRHPDKAPEMFLYELGVAEEWRRRGVAKALVLALRDEARIRGCVGMWTGTEGENGPALATYRSTGAMVDAESVFITWDAL